MKSPLSQVWNAVNPTMASPAFLNRLGANAGTRHDCAMRHLHQTDRGWCENATILRHHTPLLAIFIFLILSMLPCHHGFADESEKAKSILAKGWQTRKTATYSATEYVGGFPLTDKSDLACSKIVQRRNPDGSIWRREACVIQKENRVFALIIHNDLGCTRMNIFTNGKIRGTQYPEPVTAPPKLNDDVYSLKEISSNNRPAWEIVARGKSGSVRKYIVDKALNMLVGIYDYDDSGKLMISVFWDDIVMGDGGRDEDYAIPADAEIIVVGSRDEATQAQCEFIKQRSDEVARERKRLARQRRRQIRNSKLLGVFSRITGSDDPLAWFLDNAPFLLMPVAVIAIGTACAIKRRKRK